MSVHIYIYICMYIYIYIYVYLGCDEECSLQKKVDTRDELLACSLDAAARIKKRED
jgi:hypothetical protein